MADHMRSTSSSTRSTCDRPPPARSRPDPSLRPGKPIRPPRVRPAGC
jgi:hypothetical protein